MSNEVCVPALPETSTVPFATTIHVRDHCLCLHTQRAARALSRRFDEALRPTGLKSGQFSLLMSLNRPQPPTLGSVAQLLAMDRTTLTANLKPLEREGLVEVRVDVEDKRARRLILTEKGQASLACATPIWTTEHAAIEAELGDGEAGRLRGALNRLV
ncbi:MULTISPECIES: MarR family winged helix-turn-helix transcriptional regulator [unclassified Aureimonas]|uniref:MarR family winged helix-turn-helix transcriptional regulator n=1 Tax=unclassified Aureimonas TaxID=2615206 RepID=UPI0006FF90BB|nr:MULTISPECIES: MarR family winged helix-turn-helix transcriptional regulator [unclassified Aureimonas]KQT62941.1 MarR family transcriptional regulator [Aureimonas sp. Leaf427]KQT74822.1 MarR family transcriptional regulator [Aureimonas sp. Leaf460]